MRSLYTFALIMIEPDLTRAAADEVVVLPFGYIATVGLRNVWSQKTTEEILPLGKTSLPHNMNLT